MGQTGTTVAKAIAAGRVLYGVSCMAAPRTAMGPAAARAGGSTDCEG